MSFEVSFCNQSPQRIGSYLLVESAKIQAHVPAFLAWCKAQRREHRQAYVRRFQADENRRRLRRPGWWFGGTPLTVEQTEALVRHQVAEDDKRDWLYRNWPHREYGWDILGDSKAAARRLLDMSRVEPRVFVSSDDFDAVFRTEFGIVAEGRSSAA